MNQREPSRSITAEAVDWEAVGLRLSEMPNEWVHVAAYSTRGSAATVAYQINCRSKHPTLLRHGWFQAKSRTVNGEYRLYLRWIGHVR